MMIGDPCQLGPIPILHEVAWMGDGEKKALEDAMLVSPFTWLHQQGRFCMLDTQYRMHASIARFPGEKFYKGRLKTSLKKGDVLERGREVGTVVSLLMGSEVEVELEGKGGVGVGSRARWGEGEVRVQAPIFPWPQAARPLAVIHVEGRERRVASSYCNLEEVAVVGAVVRRLFSAYPLHLRRADVTVLSLYRGQVDSLRQAGLGVEVATINSFQGRESAVVVVSTVRAAGRLGEVTLEHGKELEI